MPEADTRTEGLASSPANVSASSVVPLRRDSMMRRFCSSDQRLDAMGSPARWTTPSTPSSPAASIVPASGSHRTATSPCGAGPRTTRTTSSPQPASRSFSHADPIFGSLWSPERPQPPHIRVAGLLGADLLGQVVLGAGLGDQLELGLEPVGV